MPFLLQSTAIALENKLPIPDFCESPIITLSESIIKALLEALQVNYLILASEIYLWA